MADKIKKWIWKAFAFLAVLLAGGIFGRFFGRLIGESPEPPLAALRWVWIAALLYWSQLIAHEGGHYLFGRLTGYRFVSFRIGSLTWIREGGKLKLKKFKLPGTGGQCLMSPPEVEAYEEAPYALYHMGGVLANGFFAFLGLWFFFSAGGQGKAFGALLGAIAGIAALVNGLPMKAGALANDGYHALTLSRDKTARRSAYLMLKVNGLKTLGVSMKEMPYEWFVLPEDADLSNGINASIRILEGEWFYGHMQFAEARICYETLLQRPKASLGALWQELACEALFFELCGLQREEVIQELYTKQLKKYVKSTERFDINKMKLKYALCLYERQEGWEREAQKIYERAQKLGSAYPIKSEVELELAVLERMGGGQDKPLLQAFPSQEG